MAMMRADVREDEKATVARFIRGLRAEIADVVELQHYLDMGELLDKTVKVERRLKRRGATRQNSNFQTKNWRNSTMKSEINRPSGVSSGCPKFIKTKLSSGCTKFIKTKWSVERSFEAERSIFQADSKGRI